MMTHHLFGVVSWGCAATGWLAKALNAHPDVFCTHYGSGHWKTHARATDISGTELVAVLDAIAGSGYLAAGDVRGLSIGDIRPIQEKFGDRFKVAVVVREPMARLRNQVALFQRANYIGWPALSYVDSFAEAVGLDPGSLSIEQRHFIHGANMLNSVIREKDVGRIYRSEDITSDPAYLIDLLLEVTRVQFPFQPAWALAAVETKRVNAHTSVKSAWSTFEKKVINSVVRPEAWREYRRIGYGDPIID